MMVAKSLLFISMLLVYQPSSPKVILFFGDSLTAGYGLSSPEDAFPSVVGKRLNKEGMSCKVINAGLSGETSAGGLARIDWVLKQPIDMLVLELGANDGLRGLPLEQTSRNLQSIIDKVKAKNPAVKIIIAGMMVPPNMGKVYADKFKIIFPELAKKNKATLIPFLLNDVAGNEKLNQSDGIHPTVEGHKIVANTVYQSVSKILLK